MGTGMDEDQRNARIFGVLFIVTFLTSIPAVLLFQPVLDDPAGYIAGGGNDSQIYLGASLELLLILANVGTAVVLYLMYRSGLVPRRMTWLGLIGGPLLLIGNIGVLFDWWEQTSAASLLVAPEFLWELSLGIYAAVWGFRRDAPILQRANGNVSPA
jgi:hypothetical protein